MKNKISKFVLLLFLIVIISMFVKGYLYKKEVEENKVESICRYVNCKTYPKSTQSVFRYYVDDKLYKTEYGGCPDNYDKMIGRYYVFHYSKIDPNKIIVDYKTEVKDTVKILNAGFTSEDLKYKY
ncbi:hypothetical protein [Flavobacterium aquaticum]|nr:hypothetical protein [Flavobacterium aquaticum]